MIRVKRRARKSTRQPFTSLAQTVKYAMARTVLELCKRHLDYGDNEAGKAKWERADAADFYRRAAELAMAELDKLINNK